MDQVIGDDVIGYPGQHLSLAELTHLVLLADGRTPSQIAQATGADRLGQQQLESTIRAKLGARTKPHMIARGFLLEVLGPRALALLLSLLSIGITPDGVAPRPPRPSRPPVSHARASRSTRISSDGLPPGELPLELVIS